MKQQCLTMVFALLCTCPSVKAIDFCDGKFIYTILSEDELTAEVNNCLTNASKEISIPGSATYNAKKYQIISIGDYAFSNFSELTIIHIPEGITNIGEGAFSDCTKLAAVELPQGTTNIKSAAFKNCLKLTTINIPEGVRKIEEYTFLGCNNLKTVYARSKTPPVCSSSAFTIQEMLYVPQECVDVYSRDKVWKKFKISSTPQLP